VTMQSAAPFPHLKYRADVDGLRAVAVIAVVLYHAFPNLVPGGFVGVDTFFVISGYLITGIIISGLDSPAGFSFADFYARRVRRIFPALILVLSATLAVGVAIFLPSELTSLAKNAIASAFFSANFMLLSEAGYFDLAAHLKPLLHLWSLGIEEQFYLAWPLALWLTPRKWRGTMIAVVITASFALNVTLVRSHPQATFYLPLTRTWELMAGALLVGVTIKGNRLREIVGALGVVCGITFFTYSDRTTFPGWAALVPVLGAGLTILGQGSVFSRIVLSHPLVAAIGRISYPLYLWHWPLLVFPRTYLFRPLTTGESVLAIVAATALAWLTYQFVERADPVGQNGRRKDGAGGHGRGRRRRRRRALGAAATSERHRGARRPSSGCAGMADWPMHAERGGQGLCPGLRRAGAAPGRAAGRFDRRCADAGAEKPAIAYAFRDRPVHRVILPAVARRHGIWDDRCLSQSQPRDR
jgi:peptidoglycan/LPS O-acetylase OafA/YrhL